jgi:hypothetical protein
MVAERIGRNPFSHDADKLIETLITREESRWVARIRVRHGETIIGDREFRSDEATCNGVTSASTVAIALVIDPEAALTPEASRPAATTPAAATPLALTAAPTAAPSRPELPPYSPQTAFVPPGPSINPSPPLKIPLVYRGLVSFGLVPGVGPGVALSAGVQRRLLEGSTGVLWIPETTSSDDAFAFGLTAGWLGLCVNAPLFQGSSFTTCGNVLGGAVREVVRSRGRFESLEPGEKAWAAVSLAPRVRITLVAPLIAEFGAEIIVPLTRYDFTFSVEDRTEIAFGQSPVALALFVSLGVSVP